MLIVIISGTRYTFSIILLTVVLYRLLVTKKYIKYMYDLNVYAFIMIQINFIMLQSIQNKKSKTKQKLTVINHHDND